MSVGSAAPVLSREQVLSRVKQAACYRTKYRSDAISFYRTMIVLNMFCVY